MIRVTRVSLIVGLLVVGAIAFLFAGGLLFGDSEPSENETVGTPTDLEPPHSETPIDEQLNQSLMPANSSVSRTTKRTHNEFSTFIDVTNSAGLQYNSTPWTQTIIDAHGSYIVDFNNNGYEDILLLGGEYPVLFENTGGAYERHRTFTVPRALVAHFFDYNNNGYRDLLLVAEGGVPRLYENDDGTFVEQEVGFERPLGYPTVITSADFTGNGCLDVFIGDWQTTERQLFIDELLIIAQEHPEIRPTARGEPTNQLYMGDCESFSEITAEAGIDRPGHTLAASATDFTGNGHVDLHVAVEWSRDYIYENNGNGTFRAIDLGPASDRNAMSSTVMDMTGNHRPDIFVTNVYYDSQDIESVVPIVATPLAHGNNLFANEGDGIFRDIAPEHGVHKGSWGWAASIADYTNDGNLDIIHGSTYANVPVIEDHPDIFAPPQVWKGTGDSWEKIHGFDLGFPEHNIRGVARVDFQNNGVLDFVTVGNPSQSDVPGAEPGANRSFLYENTHENNASVQLWIRNPDGLERNAKVYAETNKRTVYREANSRADLLSQDSRLIHIGTGTEEIQRVRVVWPDGTERTYDELVEGNRYILFPDSVEQVQ